MISACAGVDDVADLFLAGLIAQRLGVICRRLGITFARASGRLRGQGMPWCSGARRSPIGRTDGNQLPVKSAGWIWSRPERVQSTAPLKTALERTADGFVRSRTRHKFSRNVSILETASPCPHIASISLRSVRLTRCGCERVNTRSVSKHLRYWGLRLGQPGSSGSHGSARGRLGPARWRGGSRGSV